MNKKFQIILLFSLIAIFSSTIVFAGSSSLALQEVLYDKQNVVVDFTHSFLVSDTINLQNIFDSFLSNLFPSASVLDEEMQFNIYQGQLNRGQFQGDARNILGFTLFEQFQIEKLDLNSQNLIEF